MFEDRRAITFPNFHTRQSSDRLSATPISIIKEDLEGNITDRIQVNADFSTINVVNGEPTGFSRPPSQADYVTWTRMFYNDDQQLVKTLTYHNIPANDAGNVGEHYHVSTMHYDAQDRVTHRVQTVTASHHQVTRTEFDWMDRTVASYSGTGDSGLDTSPSSSIGVSPPTLPLTRVSSMEYDDGGVGDQLVTSTKRYYGTGTNAVSYTHLTLPTILLV